MIMILMITVIMMITVIVMNHDNLGDRDDPDDIVILIITVILMNRENRGELDDHAFSLHFQTDVNRGAAACSWVNSLHHQLEN